MILNRYLSLVRGVFVHIVLLTSLQFQVESCKLDNVLCADPITRYCFCTSGFLEMVESYPDVVSYITRVFDWSL